jgi:hypothetical protein
MKIILGVIVGLTLSLAACPQPVCESLQTRCEGNVAQVCDSRGQWQEVANCDEVTPGAWRCAADEDVGHTCVREEVEEP